MICKYVHATSGRAVQVPNRGSQKNFCELCNDLQRDSSKGGLLAYWLAPTASLWVSRNFDDRSVSGTGNADKSNELNAPVQVEQGLSSKVRESQDMLQKLVANLCFLIIFLLAYKVSP